MKTVSENQVCDLLIIGTGIAGLSTALEAAGMGLSVVMLTKNEDISESNTLYAQGGIVGYSKSDSSQLLTDDILRAGCYINNITAVRFISEKGPEIITEFLIDRVGVDFSKDKNGDFELTKEAAHSVRRILHSKDKTGVAVTAGLLQAASDHKNISIQNSTVALDLISNCHNSTNSQQRYSEKRIIGVYALDLLSDKIISYFSGAVVIATGGMGHIYQHTSNPSCATGDGIAMAYRTGADIINAEYIQFHPTTIYHRDINNFLVSESLRGEGAVLLNNKNEAFMYKYNSELKDLAPRDEVSRAIYTEMELTGADCVYLDAREINNMDLKERFPNIFNTCIELGIDIRSDLIPVVAAAHYFCGGIKVNLRGETSIKGLYAVGEAACTGVHGANRLASVSLLEGTVFGVSAAQNIYKTSKKPEQSLIDTIPQWIYPKKEENFDSVLIGSDLITIQTIMWNYVGIKRSESRLNRALADLNYLKHRIERFYQKAFVTREIVELRNSVETATLITKAALANQKSLGCHYISRSGD